MSSLDSDELQRRMKAFSALASADLGGRGDAPPHRLYVLLSRIVDPDEVLTSFWSNAAEVTTARTVSGRALLCTKALVHDVTYEEVPTDWYSGNPGTLGSAVVRTIRLSQVGEAQWKARVSNPAYVDVGEVTVRAAGQEWEAALPFLAVNSDGEAFYADILTTFGLEP